MASRRNPQTSIDAHKAIIPAKQAYYDKIIDGLKKLKVGGTAEQIAQASGIRYDQCWRRLDEMVKAGAVYNVGVTRKTSSGRSSMVRQLVGLHYVDPSNPVTDQQVQDLKNAGIPLGEGIIKSIEPMGKVDEDAAFKKELWIMQTVSQSKLFQ